MKSMKKSIQNSTTTSQWLAAGVAILAVSVLVAAQVQRASTPADPLVEGFKKVAVASVADAVDQVTGKRGFLSHEIRPRVPGPLVGRAATALMRPAPPEKATPALAVKHSVEMIENAKPGEVGVIVAEEGLDVATFGGLMSTTAQVKGMAGMVLDGGVRDVAEIRRLRLPVYARSVTPATAVGRFATVARQIPVTCGGVTVRPGDIIVAGEDGVVCVPAERAAEVLEKARDIDDRETRMVPLIRKHKSLQKAIEQFNRI